MDNLGRSPIKVTRDCLSEVCQDTSLIVDADNLEHPFCGVYESVVNIGYGLQRFEEDMEGNIKNM